MEIGFSHSKTTGERCSDLRMDVLAVVFGTIGGFAIFLYALHALSGSLEKFAGEKIKQVLAKLTGNPVKGMLVGTVTAAMLQSSSLTMIVLIGLINAGILTLKQGIGVMLGSEIGTTVVAQLISLKIGVVFLPLIAFGFFFVFSGKEQHIQEHRSGDYEFWFNLPRNGYNVKQYSTSSKRTWSERFSV